MFKKIGLNDKIKIGIYSGMTVRECVKQYGKTSLIEVLKYYDLTKNLSRKYYHKKEEQKKEEYPEPWEGTGLTPQKYFDSYDEMMDYENEEESLHFYDGVDDEYWYKKYLEEQNHQDLAWKGESQTCTSSYDSEGETYQTYTMSVDDYLHAYGYLSNDSEDDAVDKYYQDPLTYPNPEEQSMDEVNEQMFPEEMEKSCYEFSCEEPEEMREEPEETSEEQMLVDMKRYGYKFWIYGK